MMIKKWRKYCSGADLLLKLGQSGTGACRNPEYTKAVRGRPELPKRKYIDAFQKDGLPCHDD